MSWRVQIAPAMPNPEVADLTIPPEATPAQVDAGADACHLVPPRVFASSRDDWRLSRLMERLAADHCMGPGDSDVYVLDDGGDDSGRWIRL